MSLIDKFLGRPTGKKLRRADGAGTVEPAASVRPAMRSAERGAVKQVFPRFQSTAGDRLDPAMSDRLANVRMKLRSAYTPSQPVVDRRMFAGRTEVLTTLIRSIEDQRLHIVLYGDRGIGKTSLLHVLTQAAREARYIVIYCSCGVASDFEETFRAVAGDIPLLFHSGFAPTATEAEQGGSLADLLPAGQLSPRLISDLFAKLTGTRVLVVLDEFDRCESADFRRSIAELIKNLSDRSVRMQLVIAGVAADLTELVEHIPSIRRNVFAMQLPKMSAAEIRYLVKNGEASTGVNFDDNALQFIVQVAHGSPYIASLISHHAGLAALDQGRLAVHGDNVAVATVQALEEFRGRITRHSQLMVESLNDAAGTHPLGIMAGESLFTNGRFSTADIDRLYPNPAAAAAAKNEIRRLATERTLIAPYEDEVTSGYQFLEESVAPYIWIASAKARFLQSMTPNVAELAPRTVGGLKG